MSPPDDDNPFVDAFHFILRLLADALVALVFGFLMWGGQILMDAAWPSETDPAIYGVHFHTVWLGAKLAVFIAWLAISSWKIISYLIWGRA